MERAPYPWQLQQWHRIVQQWCDDRLAHAYLLGGEEGLGKKDFARQIAALLLCESPLHRQACGNCRSCVLINAGTNPDLLEVGPEESKVVKVDQIRQLNEFASKTSHSSGRKIIILRQADALNPNAANALLKTLEEPPGNTVLILLSDNPGKLMATLRSRCQRIQFSLPDADQAIAWLQSQIDESSVAAELLALVGNRPLLALQMLEGDQRQLRNTVLKAFSAILEGEVDPVDFAASGRSVGADRILEWLWQLTVQLIKHHLLQQAWSATDPAATAIYQRILSGERSADEILGRLLAMNRAVDEARQHLAGTSNPNPQLVLEGVLWRWVRLAA